MDRGGSRRSDRGDRIEEEDRGGQPGIEEDDRGGRSRIEEDSLSSPAHKGHSAVGNGVRPVDLWTALFNRYSKQASDARKNGVNTPINVQKGHGNDYGQPRYPMNTFDFTWILIHPQKACVTTPGTNGGSRRIEEDSLGSRRTDRGDRGDRGIEEDRGDRGGSRRTDRGGSRRTIEEDRGGRSRRIEEDRGGRIEEDSLSSPAHKGHPAVSQREFLRISTLICEMPRNARTVAPGLPYHITQRGTNRERIFFTAADRSLYLSLVRQNLAEAGVRILAYCLMTNHVHFVAIPEREDSLAVLFGRANGRYAQAINIRKGRCGHFWQARFHSCALSDTHLEIALRYVEDNPCRAGISAVASAYRWSSAAAHLLSTPDRSGILDLRFWERAGGATTWADLHAANSDADQILLLRKCTYAGRPFGEESFLESMETRFHRKWRRAGEGPIAKTAKTA